MAFVVLGTHEAPQRANNMAFQFTQHRSSRRDFARAMTSAPLILGMGAAGSGGAASGSMESLGSKFSQAAQLGGTLAFDEPTRQAYAQDYGQIIHETPLAVLRTQRVEDIQRTIEFARLFKLRIGARGEGHQPFGQAQVPNGVIIDMRSFGTVHSVTRESIDVDAGADWRTVLHAAAQDGLTPPVLTAYLGLTVGGTLSIGGVGTTTFRHGAQVDNVLELEVITGNGQVMRCSDSCNRDLFAGALAGQGQCAIIKRAVLRLVPAPHTIREYVLQYADLSVLLEDQAWLMDDDRFDSIVSVLTPSNKGWSYTMLSTRQFARPVETDNGSPLSGLRYLPGSEQTRDVPYLESADSLPKVEFGKARPDLGLILPGLSAPTFLSEVLPRLNASDWGPVDRIRLFSWKRESFTRPLFRTPAEDTFVYMAFLRTQTDDQPTVASMLKGNRKLFEKTRDLGGVLYPFSAVHLSRGDWERHYGEQWPALIEAKARYDPQDVFASGPDIFGRHGNHRDGASATA